MLSAFFSGTETAYFHLRKHRKETPEKVKKVMGGLFVGFGTTMGKGCTSGHGICGLASFSRSSLVFVLIFMAVAISTALITGALI